VEAGDRVNVFGSVDQDWREILGQQWRLEIELMASMVGEIRGVGGCDAAQGSGGNDSLV
jgi:hypothetical protein